MASQVLGKVRFNLRGAYNAATSYGYFDRVSYLGGAYVCTSSTPITGVLPTDVTKWQLDASKGDAGAAGAQGLQGPAGATGAQGLQGPAGATGAQGLQGLQGPAGAAGAGGMPIKQFTASGTFTPIVGKSDYLVRIFGASGPSGASTNLGANSGQPGGAGSTIEFIINNVTTPQNIVIGSAGTPGAYPATNATSSGTTSGFGVSVTGGAGGVNAADNAALPANAGVVSVIPAGVTVLNRISGAGQPGGERGTGVNGNAGLPGKVLIWSV